MAGLSEGAVPPPGPTPPTPPTQPAGSGRGGGPVHVDVAWSSFLLLAAVAVALVVAVDLTRAVQDTIVGVLLALVGALALDRVVVAVARWSGLPRTGAVAVVFGAALAVAALVVWLLAPALVRQGERLGHDAPAVLADLTRLPGIGPVLRDNDVPAEAQRWLDGLPERVAANLDSLAGTAQATLSYTLATTVTLLLLVLLLIEGPALTDLARRLLPDLWQDRAVSVGRSLYSLATGDRPAAPPAAPPAALPAPSGRPGAGWG